MNESDLMTAHKAAFYNKDMLAADNKCGCFCCLKIFSPSKIDEWCPEVEDGEEVTAICPHCGVDSVLGESSGFPNNAEVFASYVPQMVYNRGYQCVIYPI